MNPLKLSKAKQILEAVKTAEQAVELTGPARKEYLAALDVVHGSAEKRAKDMGFGDKTYYHGTTHDAPIDSFKSSNSKSGQLYGRGTYTTPDPEMAEIYTQKLDQHSGVPLDEESGSIYPLKVREGKSFDVKEYNGKDFEKIKSQLGVSGDPSPKYIGSREGVTPTNYSKALVDNGYNSVKDEDILNVINSRDIRSTNAAFDPRFKDSNKILAGAAAIPAMGNQFSNPADIVKAGYQKFEQARQSVVNKIVDLTDMTKDNPHVPQYAKDTYNKAADALVSNATDPLNYVGGAGAADAVIGAGSAAYEAYNSNKPTSTPANTNPVQAVNWKSR